MLTFDKIRELERTERDSNKLQKLPDDLMTQLQEYLRRKEGLKEKTSSEILELENVKNTIRRFFEIRERKIAGMALDCIRTGLPPEHLTSAEEKTFYHIVDILKCHRSKFFEELQKEPNIAVEAKENAAEERKEKPIPSMTIVEKPKQYAYKINKTLPAFVGPDTKTYELRENETISLEALPKSLNDLLLKEGVIEKVEI